MVHRIQVGVRHQAFRRKIRGWARDEPHWLVRLDKCFVVRYVARAGWIIREVRVPDWRGALVWPVVEEWSDEETCPDSGSG